MKGPSSCSGFPEGVFLKDTGEQANQIPRHVAIIMDGNGRWAKSHGLPRIKGHESGAESVRSAIKSCREFGIPYLTLYAFSSENWSRPAAEVEALMKLLRRFLAEQEYELHENRIRLRAIGRLDMLPEPTMRELRRVMDATGMYGERTLTLALSYGGRQEIADAARSLAIDVAAGRIKPESVDENAIASRLYAPDIPDPDLLIRTSGEMRISNFLLWQLSYSELYISTIMWPDFRGDQFAEAIREYGRRRRRFGGV